MIAALALAGYAVFALAGMVTITRVSRRFPDGEE